MKILFDNQIFENQRFGGISRYFAEVMVGVKKANLKIKPKKYLTNNLHLQQNGLSKLDFFHNTNYFRGKARLASLFQEYQYNQIKKALKKGNYNVFHPTYYDPTFLDYKPKDKPFILTVHDMTHEVILDKLHGKIHKETLDKRLLILEADHIIAVSEHTKKDILAFFPSVNEQKITVIHHGNSLKGYQNSEDINLEPKYFLYVGLRNTYKNFVWLLDNIASYLIRHNLTLVCAGGDAFTAKEHEQIIRLGLVKNVSQVQIKNDASLSSLYQNALSLIIPSLHEGFGIPILEAFACDCPVLANNASSLPEIAGLSAVYFNADDPNSLIQGLDKVQEPLRRSNLIESGKAELKKFSWERSVQEHLNVYRRFE